MITLSERLRKIADKVPKGARLADIGSDHALLPVYLALERRIVFAVAGEVNEGPYQAAKRQVMRYRLQHLIDVRKGDGLQILAPGEVDVITIAGMGGGLIVDILESGQDKLQGVARLILQPNVGESLVRRWLWENGWLLKDEEIVEEGGKIYEILEAEKAEDADALNRKLYSGGNGEQGIKLPAELLLKMGPYLLRRASPVFIIIARLSASRLESAGQKKQQLQKEMEEIREVLACLQKVKR
jgi:tRNA (adenine22-N1)-methyltransferase